MSIAMTKTTVVSMALVCILAGVFLLYVYPTSEQHVDSHMPEEQEEQAALAKGQGSEVTSAVVGPNRSSDDCLMAAQGGDNAELAALQLNSEAARFLSASGLSVLERDLVVELSGYRRNYERGKVVARNHPISTSPPLSKERRFALGELLDSVSLGRLLGYGGWRSEVPMPELTFGAREVAKAIEHGVTPEVLTQLLEISGVDPTVTYRYNGANLAKTAAVHGKPDLLRVLLERGANPTNGNRSVLDDLALVMPEQDDGTYADVVQQLMSAGDMPYMPSTLDTLEAVTPLTVPSSLHPDAVALIDTPEVRRTAEEFRALMDGWADRMRKAVAVEERCASVVVQAPTTSSLFAKQTYEERLRAEYARDPLLREAEVALAAAEKMILSGEIPENMKAFSRMLDLWHAGMWTAAFAVAEEWDAGWYEDLVDRALLHGAPFEIIVEVISRNGGNVPDDAMVLLVSEPWSGAARLAATLQEVYTMDVHYVDKDGRNAFYYISEQFYDLQGPARIGRMKTQVWEMAQFLAEQGVAVKSRARGLDPLDIVLLKAIKMPMTVAAATDFVRLLIDQGAPIELSHRELMQWLAQLNPEGYAELVETVPELAT